MKFALVLFALVATSSAKIQLPNFGFGELYKDIQDFLDVLPQEEIFAITVQYFSEDAEFKAMVEYFQSEGFKALVKDCEALPEIKVMMDYIHTAGIDIYRIVNLLNELLGLDPLPTPLPPTKLMVTKQIKGGIRGYVDDIMAILPVDLLNSMYEDKLKNSTEFRNFIAQLESENFQEIVNQVYLHPKMQELLDHADKAGIDLLLIKDLLEILWGIRVPNRPHARHFYIKH
ncbi:hypothetical protein ACFW04_002678 [Cataglyphis niger]